MSRAGSIYNRMKRPIAVIGSREAYIHLCRHCQLDPNDNDVFFHVGFVWDVEGKEFCRVIEVGDAPEKLDDYLRRLSVAKDRVRN